MSPSNRLSLVSCILPTKKHVLAVQPISIFTYRYIVYSVIIVSLNPKVEYYVFFYYSLLLFIISYYAL